MSIPVRQSTAVTITIGPILDADGVAVTGAVVGDLRIAKTTTAPATLNASATLTHRHTGHYSLALTASDVDTIGDATITLNKTTDAMPPKDLKVMEEAVYDSLYAVNAVALATTNASIFLPTATRNIGDTRDIAFPWPVSGATITGTTHINGATSAALTGAVTELASYPAGGFWYKLAYNAADYPSAEGFTLIRLVDGDSNVRILPVGRGAAGSATSAKQDQIIATLTGSTINIVSRVSGDGTITIYKGTDNSSTIGTQIALSKTGYTASAFASSASGAFRYVQGGGTAVTAGTVSIAQSDTTVTATLTLTDVETAAMTAAVSSTYEIEIETSGGLKDIISSGSMIVKDLVS